MIKAIDIHKSFGNLEVLKGISFEMQENQIISIVGASGAGKTTLLQILGTLEKPDKGMVLIDDIDVTTLKDKEISRFRNKNIGFVFQFYHLLPEFTALENVCIPAYINGNNSKTAEKKAMELLYFLNISNRSTHKPSELSGGEQQRVAIARALINNPKVIFADEPTGNLDSHNKEELLKLFISLKQEFGKTFVIVTHDSEMESISDKLYTMKDGVFI